ncbi:hypothetical protein ABTQ09_18165 [Acinetobacter baumannii]|uniref:hypothetical protein n=1 Tax=Acinetobacter baumannii TaxID=470 RepID=UPI00054B25E0|nr:hypothetical protein [Acinetobacter baumannii]AMN02091.1 hypothetical protein AZE33_13055 [Acinetobacter baumannii]MDB0261116.1 hypothetical protein [Acinetobacter baumannii]MDB0306081.1 hypothetical protein [Acinetobacter baumannii]MVO51303.1 hypothetical protein [Acinetobacter baumannii]OID22051.1 hypothetical protein A7L28_03235 [Acinetobacter baumannii]
MKRIDPVVLKVLGLTLVIALVVIGVNIGAKAYEITQAPWWLLLTLPFMPFLTVLVITLIAWSINPNLVFDSKCKHESDGISRLSNPPKNKCKKCGEFYSADVLKGGGQ